MRVSELVSREVYARFPAELAADIERQLAAAELPGLEAPGYEGVRARVQLAALKVAGSDAGRLADAIRLAVVDWRDLLVAANLADEDWPAVLRAAGFPAP